MWNGRSFYFLKANVCNISLKRANVTGCCDLWALVEVQRSVVIMPETRDTPTQPSDQRQTGTSRPCLDQCWHVVPQFSPIVPWEGQGGHVTYLQRADSNAKVHFKPGGERWVCGSTKRPHEEQQPQPPIMFDGQHVCVLLYFIQLNNTVSDHRHHQTDHPWWHHQEDS